MLSARFTVACWVTIGALTLAVSAQASEDRTGIIYGPDHAFAVTAPSGWVLDNKSGVDQGLWAVFYPVGSSWKNSKVVMYINTASKTGDPTLDGLIAGDLERQRKESPGLNVKAGEPIELQDGTKAKVNHWSGDRGGNHESVAYIEAPTVWVMVVLSSRNEKAYRSALPAFSSLTRTYKYLTSRVDTEQ